MKLYWILLVLFLSSFLCGCGSSNETGLMLELDAGEQMSGAETADIGPEESEPESKEQERIYVYVCGAVRAPGVYQADAGSRLYEVIEMAGGFLAEADMTSLNLARGVSDGEQIVVLTQEEAAQKENEAAQKENADAQTDSGLININTALLEELTRISGIGESRAGAIIDYREKNGAFSSIEEIKNVDGIKDGLFSKIKDYITV